LSDANSTETYKKNADHVKKCLNEETVCETNKRILSLDDAILF